MVLKHVLVGASSHLEVFAATPANSELTKLVKHVVVQVCVVLHPVGIANVGRYPQLFDGRLVPTIHLVIISKKSPNSVSAQSFR